MAANVDFAEGFNTNLGTAQFGDNKYVSGSKEFLMSNTIIAKVSFLLLVIIGFFIILRLAIQLILWFSKPNPDPYLVTCRRDGSLSKNIPVDPSVKNSIPILRSKDEREGIEFTWSTWLFIDKVHPASTTPGSEAVAYYHIFSKGSKSNESGVLGKHNTDAGPGLYLKSKMGAGTSTTVDGTTTTTRGDFKNSLYAIMNTYSGETVNSDFDKIEDGIEIENIPIRKWFHVALRIENKNFDVYVNGILYKRKVLSSLPRQNYGDVHISQLSDGGNGMNGFNGEISSLRYFNSALNPVEINNIVKVGPNMCTDDEAAEYPPYFSSRWYKI